jgi:ABC-2 type transport system permease protein
VARQLASPFSWVLVAVFALVTGAAFVFNLNAFLDQSAEALTKPPLRPINVNQLLIRPFLLDVGLAALLMLPLLTARAYGTASASPDAAPSPAARLLGAYAIYKVMLLPSMLLVLALFAFGRPEWGPIVTGYVGLLFTGAAFIAVALVLSSLATTPWAAGMATFAIALMLVTVTWLEKSGTPGAQAFFQHLSIGEPLDDFAKGILDTSTSVACVSVIALALVLTHYIARTLRPGNR